MARLNTYSGSRIKEILSRQDPSLAWVVLPDGSRVRLEECKVVVVFVDESVHLTNLIAEGNIKLDLSQEYDRKRAVLARLANPYFSLPGFERVCRHGPALKLCPICEKDKVDAQRRLGN